MSLAVEQTLPPREVEFEVGRPESDSHAAESFNTNTARTTASGRETEASAFASSTLATKPKPNRPSYDMQRQYEDAMMDAHDITTPTSEHHVVEEQAPVLPQKSALRASRLLVGLKISAPVEPLEFAQQSHHEEYLSSEEDASSTSGDFSDFEYDSSSDDIPSPPEECSKHVTARVVSVIYSGKPSVINVPQTRRSISPNSIERPMSMGGLSDRANYISGMKNRRTSVSTTMSSRSSRSPQSKRPLPPRSSSMQPPTDAMKAKLGFLRIDPYANGSSYSLSPSPAELLDPREIKSAEEPERPKTPKSPGNMFRGVARAMSLMKKRSVPRLNQAYLVPDGEQASQPTSPLRIPEDLPEEPSRTSVVQVIESESTVAAPPPIPTRPPPRPLLQPSLTHDEILRIAKKNEQQQNKHLAAAKTFHGDVLESPISPMSPLSKDTPIIATNGKRMSSFGFGRRRMSVKLGGKFQL